MKMKKILSVLLIFTALVAALACGGCASARARNTETMLSAAGFRTMTPSTPEQQANFAAMPPNKVVRHEFNGSVTYTYADKKNGIVYKGNESNYQRFQQLSIQQQITEDQLAAAEINQQASWGWPFWDEPGIRW